MQSYRELRWSCNLHAISTSCKVNMKNSAQCVSFQYSKQSLPSWNKHHSNNPKYDIKLYISDKGMNKSLRHRRLLYTKYNVKEWEQKTKSQKKKTWLHSVNALSRSRSVACEERRMLQLISVEIDETLSDSPAGIHSRAQRGGRASRAGLSNLKSTWFVFPTVQWAC